MTEVTGTVENVSTKYGKYSVQVNGTWYGTKEEWARCKPEPGQAVVFDDAGGKFTKNMRIVGGDAVPASSGAAPAKQSYSPAASRSFPVGALAPERAINRQNALTNAVKFLDGVDGVTSTDDVISTARSFEAYTTGDLDAAEAKEAAEAMKSMGA
jgi:hypothetical protein